LCRLTVRPAPAPCLPWDSDCPCLGTLKVIPMKKRRVGLWLIGAFGGVGSTAALGLAALGRGLTDTTSLVTALPLFENVDLDAADGFVLGGHDIRRSSFRQAVRELHERSNVFDAGLIESC